MRKKMFSVKNIAMLFMAFGLLTSVGCRKQDDSGKATTEEVQALKTDLQKKLTMLENDLKNAKQKLAELQGAEGVTKADIDAAKEAVIAATVEKAAFEAYKESNDGKIAKLETLVGTNKGTLEEALANLKKEFNGSLTEKIKAFETKIETNKAELLKMLEEMLNGRYTNEQIDAKLKEMGLAADTRLNSLVLLPDYVSDASGALPIIRFSSVATSCGTLVPQVVVQYVVNPSTVTEADIDKDNLKFKYNDPINLSARKNTAGVDQKVEFVSLKDGILTVKASLNTKKLWSAKQNDDNRIDELMLQVATKGGAVVSSDWAKITYGEDKLALVKKLESNESAAVIDDSRVLPDNLSDAKDLQVGHDVRVKNIAWDATVDLNDLVSIYTFNDNDPNNVIYDSAKAKKYEDLGLTFVYDFMDENGDKITYTTGDNKTNQQEFASLNGSMFSTRVYTKKPNRAAIGRTPIVHVTLKKDNCVVKEGFIKFNIVEIDIKPIDPIEFMKGDKTITAVCDNDNNDEWVEIYRVNTQEMNEEFYARVAESGMSKADFHQYFHFEGTTGEGVGRVFEEVDSDDNESYNLVYKVKESDLWANGGTTVKKVATYTYGSSVIKMTFKVNVLKEKANLNIALDNYWYDNNGTLNNNDKAYIIHNVAVPPIKGLPGSNDPDEATFTNNIAAAFTTNNDKLVNLAFGKNTIDKATYDNYSYEFVFADEQPTSPVAGITLKVSPDKKQLIASRGGNDEVVAKIHDQKADTDRINDNDDGDPLEYIYENGTLAKELLNKAPEAMKATLKLVVKNSCGNELEVNVETLTKGNMFDVHFLRPVNIAKKSVKDFVDAVDKGDKGSTVDMLDLADLSDWRKYKKEKDLKGVKEDKYDFARNSNYYDYYDVEAMTVNVDEIKVEGLTVNGTPVTTLPSTMSVKQTNPTNNHKYGRLVYENNGTNLNKEFTMLVPVTVTYKFGEVTEIVSIKVKPTDEAARKAAK